LGILVKQEKGKKTVHGSRFTATSLAKGGLTEKQLNNSETERHKGEKGQRQFMVYSHMPQQRRVHRRWNSLLIIDADCRVIINILTHVFIGYTYYSSIW